MFWNAFFAGMFIRAYVILSSNTANVYQKIEDSVRDYYADVSYKSPPLESMDQPFRSYLIKKGIPDYRADTFASYNLHTPKEQLPSDIYELYLQYKLER